MHACNTLCYFFYHFQPLDDRVSLEQTCKILSAYRFASSDDNLYSCHICEAKLRGRQTLYEHIRGTHLCAHIYRCPNCGLSFKWRSGLQRHRTRCPNNGSAQVLTPPVIDMWCSNIRYMVDMWHTYMYILDCVVQEFLLTSHMVHGFDLWPVFSVLLLNLIFWYQVQAFSFVNTSRTRNRPCRIT